MEFLQEVPEKQPWAHGTAGKSLAFLRPPSWEEGLGTWLKPISRSSMSTSCSPVVGSWLYCGGGCHNTAALALTGGCTGCCQRGTTSVRGTFSCLIWLFSCWPSQVFLFLVPPLLQGHHLLQPTPLHPPFSFPSLQCLAAWAHLEKRLWTSSVPFEQQGLWTSLIHVAKNNALGTLDSSGKAELWAF